MEQRELANTATKSRHQRKMCGYCDELLSYSAYRAHRALYFNQSKQQWVREPESQDPGYTGSSEYNDDDSMEFGDEPGPEEADDSCQTGSNALEYFLCDLQLSEHVASLSFTAWLNMTLYCYYRNV